MTKIIKIQEGATVKNGKIKQYKSGYQVCVNSKEEVFATLKKAIDYATKKALKSYGLWLNGGKWYLDTNSIRVNTKQEAIKLAKNNKQLGIWNWSKKETVYIQ